MLKSGNKPGIPELGVLMIKIVIILIFHFCTLNLFSQSHVSDSTLIRKSDFSDRHFEKRVVHFGIFEKNDFIVKYNPVSLVFSSALFFYQKFISSQFQAGCLFVPSCSAYGKLLISEYGIFKGTFCTADRLMRCNRLSAGDLNLLHFDEKHKKVHESVDYYRLK